jgi:hypothetical protein
VVKTEVKNQGMAHKQSFLTALCLVGNISDSKSKFSRHFASFFVDNIGELGKIDPRTHEPNSPHLLK